MAAYAAWSFLSRRIGTGYRLCPRAYMISLGIFQDAVAAQGRGGRERVDSEGCDQRILELLAAPVEG
jgi:hypothetical protein